MPKLVPILALALLASGRSLRAADASPASAEQVKVAFLYNFVKFTQWPADAFADAQAPLVICVVGAADRDRTGAARFSDLIAVTLRGRRVDRHPVAVERHAGPEDIGSCHVLVVEPSLADRLPELERQLAGRSILTVSEMGDFAEDGGTIGLVIEADRVRFHINLESAERARLKLSSQLLALATRVLGRHRPERR